MPKNKIAASARHLFHEITTNALWGLVIAVAVSLVTNVMTIGYIISLQNDLQSLFQRNLLGQNNVQAAEVKALSLENRLERLVISRDPGMVDTIKADTRAMEQLLIKAKPLYHHSRRGAALLTAVTRDFTQSEKTFDTLIALVRAGESTAALAAVEESLEGRIASIDRQLDRLDDIKQRRDIKVFKGIDYQLSISVLFTILAVIGTIGLRLFLFRRKRKSAANGDQ